MVEKQALVFSIPCGLMLFIEKKPQLPQLFHGNVEDDYETLLSLFVVNMERHTCLSSIVHLASPY